MSSNGISKPRSHIKTSDRRLAAGKQPSKYLHSAIASSASPIVLNTKKSHRDEQTVRRKAGGKSWEDSSLLEWNPQHFRLFVGNLGQDVNDDVLCRSFAQFPSLSKAKVPVDTKTRKNKGYGFVSFESPDDYLRAFKEMNGKYVGQRPVQLKKAETEIKATKKGRR